jgi:hypothetical protein
MANDKNHELKNEEAKLFWQNVLRLKKELPSLDRDEGKGLQLKSERLSTEPSKRFVSGRRTRK